MVSNSTLVSSIQCEILKVKEDLNATDESLKRLTGRDFNQPPKRNNYDNYEKNEDSRKNTDRESRKRGPSGIFARLGAPILDASQKPERRKGAENQFLSRTRRVSDEFVTKEDTPRNQKPAISSSVSRPPADGKSRSEAAAALTKDRASRDRNRRMFGALLGTLERFKNEEAKQKDKEEQRAAIERKLEEKGKAEKEEMKKEREELIENRKKQQQLIKRLHFNMMRVKEHESWQRHQKGLTKFIRTQSSPPIFWLPKIHNKESEKLMETSAQIIEDELESRRSKLNEELEIVLKSRNDEGEKENTIDKGLQEPAIKRAKISHEAIDDDEHNLDYGNVEDVLDFEIEEPQKSAEAESLPLPARLVVQVSQDVNGVSNSYRKIEVVSSKNLPDNSRKIRKNKKVRSSNSGSESDTKHVSRRHKNKSRSSSVESDNRTTNESSEPDDRENNESIDSEQPRAEVPVTSTEQLPEQSDSAELQSQSEIPESEYTDHHSTENITLTISNKQTDKTVPDSTLDDSALNSHQSSHNTVSNQVSNSDANSSILVHKEVRINPVTIKTEPPDNAANKNRSSSSKLIGNASGIDLSIVKTEPPETNGRKVIKKEGEKKSKLVIKKEDEKKNKSRETSNNSKKQGDKQSQPIDSTVTENNNSQNKNTDASTLPDTSLTESERRRKLKEKLESITLEVRKDKSMGVQGNIDKNVNSKEKLTRKDSKSSKKSGDESDSSSSGSEKDSSSSSESENSSEETNSSDSSSSSSSTESEKEKRRQAMKKKLLASRKKLEEKRKALSSSSSSSESESNSRNKRRKNWNSRSGDRKRRRSKSSEGQRSRPSESKRSRK